MPGWVIGVAISNYLTTRRGPRFSRWKFNLTLVVSTLVVIFSISMWWMERQLSGPLVEWARIRAINIATSAINESTREILGERLERMELIHYVGGEGGTPPVIRYNMGSVNQVMSEAVRSILDTFREKKPEEFSVPLGEISGMRILAAWGPPIPVRILTTGSVVARPKVDFQSAGINQVVHRLYIDVEVQMLVVAPFAKDPIVVRQPVIVAEEVLPGAVPDTYVNLVGYSGEFGQWLALLEAMRGSEGEERLDFDLGRP